MPMTRRSRGTLSPTTGHARRTMVVGSRFSSRAALQTNEGHNGSRGCSDGTPKRAQKLEWNLNAIILLVTLFGMCVGGVTIWVKKDKDREELLKWRNAMEARREERFRTLESEVRKIDNLANRVASSEQSSMFDPRGDQGSATVG